MEIGIRSPILPGRYLRAIGILQLHTMSHSKLISNFTKCDRLLRVAVAALSLATVGPAFGLYTENFGCGGPKGYALAPDAGGEALIAAIGAEFMEGRFKSLLDAADRWKDGRCRLKDGQMQIDFWLGGFTNYFTSVTDWNASLVQVERFKAAYPKSALPHLVEARYWSDYANFARGFGYASTVTPQGWKLFKERLEKSERLLKAIKEESAEWSLWYWQMIRVENLLGRSKASVNQIFLEGVRRFPDDLAIYTEMQYYLEPRWGGSWSDVDRIVDVAVKNVLGESPDATYAKMYWATGDIMPSSLNLFKETLVSWPRMRRGFIDLLRTYPRSSRITNGVLAYACLAGDKETYVTHRGAMGPYDENTWQEAGTSLAQCDATLGTTP